MFHILPKVEVKENFPRFFSFPFCVGRKIEISKTSETGVFFIKGHRKTIVSLFLKVIFKFFDFLFHIPPKI